MKKILVMAAVMLLGTMGMQAAGTLAGTDITNSASLSFSVSGVPQTGVNSNTDTFKVDKKIDFALSNNDGDQVSVVPGQPDAITTWSFRNEGNLDQNFTFTARELTGGESIYADPDTKDTNGPRTIEYNNGGVWTALSTLEIAPDTNITIRIKTDIDASRVDGDVMNIELKAVAVDGSGAAEINTAGADNQTVVDTVLAEGTGITSEGNQQHNNTFTRWGGYIVESPVLDLTKLSCVYSDPINTTTDPKRIPGATIFYVFDINNTSATTDATDVNLTDDISDDLTTASLSRVWKGTTVNCECNDGEDHGDTAVSGGGADDTASVGATIAVATNVIDLTSISITKSTHTCIAVKADIK